jgi:DNA-binding response OmpR family regulator
MITMTWPQYRRSQCSIGDWTVDLSPIEAELLSTLLLRYPNPVTINELVDIVYPDPDSEPDYPEGQIVQRMMHLARKIGTFRLDNCGRSIGYRLYQCPDDAKVTGLKAAA